MVILPVYQKIKNDGLGERLPYPKEGIRVNSSKVDIWLIEGWMVGYRAQGSADFMDQQLERYDPIWNQINCMILLRAPSLKIIYQWRLEQERSSEKASGLQGLNERDLTCFVDNFMPAYAKYYFSLPATVRAEDVYIAHLNEKREYKV